MRGKKKMAGTSKQEKRSAAAGDQTNKGNEA